MELCQQICGKILKITLPPINYPLVLRRLLLELDLPADTDVLFSVVMSLIHIYQENTKGAKRGKTSPDKETITVDHLIAFIVTIVKLYIDPLDDPPPIDQPHLRILRDKIR